MAHFTIQARFLLRGKLHKSARSPLLQLIIRSLTVRPPVHERLFHRAFQHAPLGMALANPDGGWVQVNEAFCKMLGYSEDELLQLPADALTPPEDPGLGAACLARMTRGEIPSCQSVLRFRRKDGEAISVRLEIALLRDESGSPEMFVLQAADITVWKAEEAAAQEALRENAARLAAAEERKREIDKLRGQIFTVCAWTKRIFFEGKWITTDEFLTEHLQLSLTHSISEDALKDVLADLDRQIGDGPADEGKSA
jgi:PAS domain S-box-containing protein